MPSQNSPANTSQPVFSRLATRSFGFSLVKVFLFTALLIAASASKITLPGNPVPITLQTFALMVMALSLTARQAAASVISYLSLGAAGLPVFSGGIAAAALIGPSAGYLYAFVPAVIVTAMLKARWNSQSGHQTPILRMYAATVIGCVIIPLLVGIPVQSLLTGVPLNTTIVVSSPFILNDLLKAGLACAIIVFARAVGSKR